MNLLIKYPSRQRPTQFMNRLNSMVQMADKASELFFLFTFDANDSTMFPVAKMIEGSGLNGEIHFGTSKSKIEAVNRDIEKVEYPWDILLLMSDDMVCVQKGWDTIVKEAFPNDLSKLLWHFDGYQKDITTMPIMNRAYFDLDRYIYHPRYKSLWCDNEQTDVARLRGMLAFDERVLFRHAHPANDAEVGKKYRDAGDTLHGRNEAFYYEDEKVYNDRKAKGFPK